MEPLTPYHPSSINPMLNEKGYVPSFLVMIMPDGSSFAYPVDDMVELPFADVIREFHEWMDNTVRPRLTPEMADVVDMNLHPFINQMPKATPLSGGFVFSPMKMVLNGRVIECRVIKWECIKKHTLEWNLSEKINGSRVYIRFNNGAYYLDTRWPKGEDD